MKRCFTKSRLLTMRGKRQLLWGLGIGLVLCFLVALALGRYSVPLGQVWRILLSRVIPLEQTWTDGMAVAVLNLRLPRLLGAAMVGAALSAAGCVYQTMFSNPMASPDLLGTAAGAGFGAAISLLLGLSAMVLSMISFTTGLVATLLAVLLARGQSTGKTVSLILAGVLVGSLFSAGTSYLKLIADPTSQLPAITYWLMGSFASFQAADLWLLAPSFLCGIVPLLLMRWRLNALAVSPEEARALGVNVRLLRTAAICCATLLTSASVAVSGMIGWVGLCMPHLARHIGGADLRTLLPASALCGAGFLLLVDTAARTIHTTEIPIGILTAVLGAPLFLLLLHRGRRRA